MKYYITHLLWDRIGNEVTANIVNEQGKLLDTIDVLSDFKGSADAEQAAIDEASRLGYTITAAYDYDLPAKMNPGSALRAKRKKKPTKKFMREIAKKGAAKRWENKTTSNYNLVNG